MKPSRPSTIATVAFIGFIPAGLLLSAITAGREPVLYASNYDIGPGGLLLIVGIVLTIFIRLTHTVLKTH